MTKSNLTIHAMPVTGASRTTGQGALEFLESARIIAYTVVWGGDGSRAVLRRGGVMKALVIVAVFIALAVPLGAQHNFRDVKWGMSPEQVRQAEKAKLREAGPGGLTYDIELFLTRCLIVYSFFDGKLFRAGYATDEYYMNDALYFDTYEKFKLSLSKKYGKPKDEVRYVPDAYKDDLGTGLAKGIVFYYSYWDLGDVEILLMVDGGEQGQHVTVEYTNKELKRAAEVEAEGVEENF